MNKRPLTPAGTALIEKIATSSPLGVFTATHQCVVVSDEVDEQGPVQWTATVALGDVLPNA